MDVKAKLNGWKLWWLLVLFVAGFATFPSWSLFVRYLFDPNMPASLTYKYREHRNRASFDSEKWKRFPRSTNEWPHTDLLPIRIRMVEDLLKRYNFGGQTRNEVEKLLGPKTKTEYFSDWDLVYYLGPGRYGNAVGDSEWLVFRFDSSGRVQEYKVVHD